MEITLPNVVIQRFHNSKDFLKERSGIIIDSVADVTEKARTSLPETAEQAKSTITQTANQAVDNFNQVANKTVGSIPEFTEKVKGSLSETTTSTLNTVNEVTGKVVGGVTVATENAKTSLENSIQQADHLSNSVSAAVQSAIRLSFNDWINQHPVILWLVSHPLLTLAIFFIAILLLLGFFNAIARLVEKVWVMILQSPFILGKSLLGLGFKSWGKTIKNGTVNVGYEAALNNSGYTDQLKIILKRLDAIQQEQNVILQELSALRKSNNLADL